MKIQFYHNAACGTSRTALELLLEQGADVSVRNLVDEPLSLAELEELLDVLDLEPMDLVRTSHPQWKAEFADLELDDDEEILLALIEFPAMMQRPVVVNEKGRAFVARPAEKVLDILRD
jgi:arsenate reductase